MLRMIVFTSFMPLRQIAQTLLMRPRFGPSFYLPVTALNHSNEVQDFAAPERISNDMPTHANPVRTDKPTLMRRQALYHRHQPAPGHDAGKPSRPLPENLLPHLRVHPIRADQHIARHMLAIAQMQHNAIIRLLGPRHTHSPPELHPAQPPALHPAKPDENPPDGPSSKAHRNVRPRSPPDRTSANSARCFPAAFPCRSRRKRLASWPLPAPAQSAAALRSLRLHPGPDLPQLGGLLEQPHLMAPLIKAKAAVSPPSPAPAISTSAI